MMSRKFGKKRSVSNEVIRLIATAFGVDIHVVIKELENASDERIEELLREARINLRLAENE